MANESLAISDGTFTLSETEVKNQFYFYRNDGEVLTDIDREPMDLYQAYIIHKMVNDETTNMIMSNFYMETSDDGRCIRLTICDIGENPVKSNNSTVRDKHPNFIKHLFNKIFG